MTSFVYRDARRQIVGVALAALSDEQSDLRQALESEQIALQPDDWTVSDRTYLAVTTDWVWATQSMLKTKIGEDQALRALNRAPALSDEQAAAIESLPHLPEGPPSDYIDQIRHAIGQDESIFTELLHAAHSRWIVQSSTDRLHPYDEVGVLLPLRLETLFDEPNSTFNDDPARWKLSLRVIPDEASICRNNNHISKGEKTALETFWEEIKQPGDLHESWLDGDSAEIAWNQLSERVTPARAAWLVPNVNPRLDGENVILEIPAHAPDKAQPNRVGGLPPELKVFATTTELINGDTHHTIGRLPMEEHKYIHPDTLELPLPANDLTEEKIQWWTSWEGAKVVGLGGEWLLPAGMNPQTLSVIYVVGIGEESAIDHFTAQADAGELSVLRLGMPTNSVHGKPTTDINIKAGEWLLVAKMRLGQRLNPLQKPPTNVGESIQQYLTGNPYSIPYFPGADFFNDAQDSQHMVAALWPALSGHWLHDLWQTGDNAFRVGLWVYNHLCPEGPLMPIRISDQPYGLLPVTALSQWESDISFMPEHQQQREVEMHMAAALNTMRGSWAAAVKDRRHVVGKSTRQFIELLGQDALSQRYIWRQFIPAWLSAVAYSLDSQRSQEFLEKSMSAYRTAIKYFEKEPDTPYLANGYWKPNLLPLVQPTRMLYRHQHQESRERLPLPDFLTLLFDPSRWDDSGNRDIDDIFRRSWVIGERDNHLSSLPDSLIIRLLIYASQVALKWRHTLPDSIVKHDILHHQEQMALFLAEMIDREEWQHKDHDPLNEQQPIFTLHIPEERRGQLERSFCATLDSAAHRIDPWITGFAWQRLKNHSHSHRQSYRLGAYGWVDGPFKGRPGPTDAGRLHTPSYNQTLAALILRDKFLSTTRATSKNEQGTNPWEMNITSKKVRLAEEIAEEVRMGFHIYETVGRRVEEIIGKHQLVNQLRRNPLYAMYPERSSPNEVCNGKAALDSLLAGHLDHMLDADSEKALDQRNKLQELQAALDTYSDLLITDGVMQLVNRQTDRASETMNAAAGFSRPPTFEFIKTPPSGYQLESVVLSALPFVSAGEQVNEENPIWLADPSVAAFITTRLGNNWTWEVRNEDNDSQLGNVSLLSMNLSPVDTLALSNDFLGELVRHKLGIPIVYISESQNRSWVAKDDQDDILGRVTLAELKLSSEKLAAITDAELMEEIRNTLGLSLDSIIEEVVPLDPRLWIATNEHKQQLGMAHADALGLTSADVNNMDIPELHKRIRQHLGLPLARIIPPRQHQMAQQIVAALGSRPATGRDLILDPIAQQTYDTEIYKELFSRYERLRVACQHLIDDLRSTVDEGMQVATLRRAMVWGILPITETSNQETVLAVLNGTTLPNNATLSSIREIMVTQLEKRKTDAPDMLTNISDLVQAIANLASPNARLAILGCWPQEALVNHANIQTDQIEQTLDDEWLTVIATTRANMARLEALQLEMDQPLKAWTNAPGDPWRKGELNIVQENLRKRETESSLDMKMPKFVAAYGPADAWVGERVAIGMIDAFSEAIPMPQRSTATAFGFNAPSARPPQAILLAVPPKPRQCLEVDLLRQIVEETRELAHARTARIEDLADFQSMMPTMWLQSSGPAKFRPEPWPLFVDHLL